MILFKKGPFEEEISRPLTDGDLRYVEHLVKEASEGPWEEYANTVAIHPSDLGANLKKVLRGNDVRGQDPYGRVCKDVTVGDMEFIAAARTIVPRMSNDIKRYRKGIRAVLLTIKDPVAKKALRDILNSGPHGGETPEP